MAIENTSVARAIRIGEVVHLTGTSAATVWRWVNSQPSFPKPFRLSSAVTVWDEAEVLAWLEAKKAVRGAA